MSPDVFEDELRTLLHGATEAQSPAFEDVDTDAVLASGHRVVRRRRIAAVGGTVAAALVVAAGTWAAIGDSADRAAPIPATRTTAPPTTSGTASVDLETSALSSEVDGTLSRSGERLRVQVDRATGVVRYSTLRDDTSRDVEVGRVPSVPLGATWKSLSSMQLLVGLLPEEAVQLQLVTPTYDDGGHASTSVDGLLPGTGRKAFAVSFAEAGDAEAVRGILWWAQDGTVHDDTGSTVPSVALGDPEGTVVYVSEELDRMGTFSDGDGTTMMAMDGSRNSSGRPVLSSGRGDGAEVSWFFAAVVPAGAEPGRLTPAAGATVTTPPTKVVVPGTDLAVLWSRLTSRKDAKGGGYASVTWTEDGRTVTQTP